MTSDRPASTSLDAVLESTHRGGAERRAQKGSAAHVVITTIRRRQITRSEAALALSATEAEIDAIMDDDHRHLTLERMEAIAAAARKL
jgi:hypothetical protein